MRTTIQKCSLNKFVLLLLLYSFCRVSVHAQVSVPLTVQEALYAGAPTSGINRTQDPVTVGVPLPDSAAITTTSQLGLTGASAGQFRALGRWPWGTSNGCWLTHRRT